MVPVLAVPPSETKKFALFALVYVSFVTIWNVVQEVFVVTGIVNTVTHVFAGNVWPLAPQPPLPWVCPICCVATIEYVRYSDAPETTELPMGPSGKAFVGEGHHALEPKAVNWAVEAVGHWTVKTKLLTTKLNELVFALKRTSNVFAVVPGTRSISTEVGNWAEAVPANKRARVVAPKVRRSRFFTVRNMDRGFGRELVLGSIKSASCAGQGNCSVRVLVGTEPPMFERIGSRSLPLPVYFTKPSRLTSSSR